MSEQTTDEKIAVQVTRAPEMFGFLIDRYEQKLDRYIKRMSGLDEDQRKDVLQDVFIKTYQNIASFDPEQSFNSWIYRICHNTVINDWKKNKKYREGQSFDSDESHFLENLLSDDESLTSVLQTENSKLVVDALNKIKESYRQILVLKYYEDMSYEEIRDVLQIPGGTVATNIHRAKKALAKELLLDIT